MVLLSLLGLIDPPHEEAGAAVRDCQAAGIRVKMITGDHAATASEIARQLGFESHGALSRVRELDRQDEATGNLSSGRTGSNQELLRQMLEVCANACRLCGEECALHAEMHEHCRLCAEACKSCEGAYEEAITCVH